MKLLVIGDFHGTFPNKFNDIIKKEQIDLVISNGDYFPFHYRKLWFKHCYAKDTQLWEVIGKQRFKELIKKDLQLGERALKKLNELPVPVLTVYGNVDYTRKVDSLDYKTSKEHYWDWDEQDLFTPLLKKYKNIHRIDYTSFKFKDFVFIGAYGGSSPGDSKSKTFKKHYKILDKLFKKYRKENKQRKIIFLSHNVPNNTKLDKLSMKAHILVRGKHYGSKLVRNVINKHHPFIHIGGHIHEGRGTQRLKTTLCINPGSAHEGKAALLDLSSKNPRVKMIQIRIK